MKLREKMKRFCTLDVHNHAGFTLVELIIVIAILAILSTGAIAGYSAYVERAKEAADMNLLSAYNTAFNAACAENGVPMTAVEGTQIKLKDGDNGTKLYDGIAVKIDTSKATRSGGDTITDKITTAFETYLGEENKTIAFKVYSAIFFSNGSFVGYTSDNAQYSYGGGYVYFSAADIVVLKNSTFNEKMTVDGLLEKVNMTTELATEMLGNGSTSMTVLMSSPDFLNAAAKAMGTDLSGLEGKLGVLAQQKIDEAAKNGITLQLSDAVAQVKANAAVLYAAQSSKDMTADKAIEELLKGETFVESIRGNLTSTGDTAMAMSNAALAYGMYTAYANYSGDETALGNTENPSAVLEGLQTEGFQNYLKTEQGKADAAAYLAALNMINSSTDDTKAVENLMVNGFDDPELAALLNQAMGN